ncbi:DCC-interacting protein 13-alpha-like isoform X2 [Lineus longissimus]|uniref:DCC-interacting protein 13-alpha-like isoform X2 n=1 Tax=Lineus longissimus TaxID=88925 RepID=UPI00315CD793
MPGIEKLHLEDALADSPQTRNLLGVFEKDAWMLKGFAQHYHRCCDRVHRAQCELSAATASLSHLLKTYDIQKFPLDNDDTILKETIKQFTGYLDEISSMQQILATQLGDSMMYPINRFLQADLEEISTMFEMFQISSSEHENAMNKYMKISKKSRNEKERIDSNEELYVMRKKFHQTNLHYYSSLNALQYKRKYAFLEPMLGYMHAHRSFFAMCQEVIVKPEVEEFLGNTSASCQGVHQEMNHETQKTVDFIDALEQQSHHLYYAEPVGDMPFIPPNTTLTQKAGYLFIRKKEILSHKWERCYFFIQGGNLMIQNKDEVAGCLVLDLNEEGTRAVPCEADDRRFVFQVVSPSSKKSVILQAENDRDKEEWTCTINNVVKEGGYVKDKTPTRKKNKQRPTSVSEGSPQIKGSASGDSASGSSKSGPPSPPTTPGDAFLSDTPIQFDMISPSDEGKTFQPPKDGPQRINPFDQTTDDIVNADSSTENSAYCQTFVVRFLGSMEVKLDRGEQLVHETIRQIMAARAIHNIFRMTESHLMITSENMRLLDPTNKSVRTEFALEDISFWSAHKENKRLFAFITRNKEGSADGHPSFACHVFECNTSGEEICQAISAATRLAFQSLMDPACDEIMEKKAQRQHRKSEQELLMSNIAVLDDEDSDTRQLAEEPTPALSPDGKFLILRDVPQDSAAPPSRSVAGGDERTTEGAGCESEA